MKGALIHWLHGRVLQAYASNFELSKQLTSLKMAVVRGVLHFLKKFVKFVRSRLLFIWSVIPKFISCLQYLLQGFVILSGRAGTLEWSIQVDKEQFNQTIVATVQLIESKYVSEFFNSDQSFWQTQSSQVHCVDFTKETFLYKRLDHLTETGQKDDVQHFRHRVSEIYANMWEKKMFFIKFTSS